MKNNMTFIHEPSGTTPGGCFHMWSVKIALDIRQARADRDFSAHVVLCFY